MPEEADKFDWAALNQQVANAQVALYEARTALQRADAAMTAEEQTVHRSTAVDLLAPLGIAGLALPDTAVVDALRVESERVILPDKKPVEPEPVLPESDTIQDDKDASIVKR